MEWVDDGMDEWIGGWRALQDAKLAVAGNSSEPTVDETWD